MKNPSAITSDVVDDAGRGAEHCGKRLRVLVSKAFADHRALFGGKVLGVLDPLAHDLAPPDEATDHRANDEGCCYPADDKLGRGHAAWLGRAMPCVDATSFKWASRDGGIPFLRQLWTVETGAWIKRATAEVPPSASIT